MLTPGIAGRYRDDVAWMLEADGVDALTGAPEEGRPAVRVGRRGELPQHAGVAP